MAELETTFRRLDGPIDEKFDCGAPEQNNFLLKDAWGTSKGAIQLPILPMSKECSPGISHWATMWLI